VGVPSPSRILEKEKISIIPKNLFKKNGNHKRRTIENLNSRIDENYKSTNALDHPTRDSYIKGFDTQLYSQKIITKKNKKNEKYDLFNKRKKSSKVRRISISHRSRNRLHKKNFKTYSRLNQKKSIIKHTPNITKEVIQRIVNL
jgi:hypothetical protein